MGRRLDVDNLVGVTEIAGRLGLKSANVIHDWVRRYPEFPAPIVKLAMGNVWNWPEVERWAKATGRLQ